MGLLDDKTAVVTGGSSGIGFATAQRFIDEGATVIITGREFPWHPRQYRQSHFHGDPRTDGP